MTEFFSTYEAIISLVSSAISILATVLLILHINYFFKAHSRSITAGYVLGAIFFPLITAIVFACKKNDYKTDNYKICVSCGNKYPKEFVMCDSCLIDLPEKNEAESSRYLKLHKRCQVGFWVVYVISIVASVVYIGGIVGGIMGDMGDMWSLRISVKNENGDMVFYDKKGNEYETEDDVIIYDKDGNEYVYKIIEEVCEDVVTEEGETTEEPWTYEEYYYVDQNGEKFISYSCYVDEEGYFYFDEKDELDIGYDEEEFYYDDVESYKYYKYPMVDKEGNRYYSADEASWNEKGELILENNDPSAKK